MCTDELCMIRTFIKKENRVNFDFILPFDFILLAFISERRGGGCVTFSISQSVQKHTLNNACIALPDLYINTH